MRIRRGGGGGRRRRIGGEKAMTCAVAATHVVGLWEETAVDPSCFAVVVHCILGMPPAFCSLLHRTSW